MKSEDEIQLVHDKLTSLIEDAELRIMIEVIRPEVGVEIHIMRAVLCWILNHKSTEVDENLKFMDEYFESMGIKFIEKSSIVH